MITVHSDSITLSGRWILPEMDAAKSAMDALKFNALSENFTLDASHIESIDTNGCYLISKLLYTASEAGKKGTLTGLKKEDLDLFNFIDTKLNFDMPPAKTPALLNYLSQLGKYGINLTIDAMGFLAFTGEASLELFKNLLRPWRIRWRTFWANIQTAGVNALAIVGLLNFLVGFVITYQGGTLLRMFGVNIFAVDLITISTLRILAPMLTAIIIAGRTGSAFAAQIGTMKVNEEVDALETIGINPIDQLVIPKLLAMLVAMPFLTIFADILGILGGMVLSYTFLDISFAEFLERIPQTVTINSFLVGLAQTPVFAIIITFVGCYQGFQVQGGADSVGRQTTTAVVQSIFLVIIFEAIFSITTRNIGL